MAYNNSSTISKQIAEENIIINEKDGLPNLRPSILANVEDEESSHNDDNSYDPEFEELPNSLIVTNIHHSVFTSEDKKKELEDLFIKYDPTVSFHWLRSFKRLRVNFKTSLAAASARIELHQYKTNESVITCYFAQPVTPVKNSSLQPPAPYKQFLISPPASPPLDWEPHPEGEPIINHDLIAALATLAPGDSHELHPSSPGQPSIVVYTALSLSESAGNKPSIVKTKCPESQQLAFHNNI